MVLLDGIRDLGWYRQMVWFGMLCVTLGYCFIPKTWAAVANKASSQQRGLQTPTTSRYGIPAITQVSFDIASYLAGTINFSSAIIQPHLSCSYRCDQDVISDEQSVERFAAMSCKDASAYINRGMWCSIDKVVQAFDVGTPVCCSSRRQYRLSLRHTRRENGGPPLPSLRYRPRHSQLP